MRKSGCLFSHEQCPLQPCQFKRSCLFLSIFLLLIISIIGVPTLITIFIIKPQKPAFSLQNVRLDAYKLDVVSNSSFLVSSIASLTLNASNPNKIGISYSPSRLHLYSEGLPVAVIRVPEFYQPARSHNVTVKTRVLVDSMNVTKILDGRQNVEMKMLGDVKVKLHLKHLTLPKIKVALDCDINFGSGEIAIFINEVRRKKSTKSKIASIVNDSKCCFQKCNIGIYI